MNSLKEIVNSRIVSPNIDTAINAKSIGIVLAAYEQDNLCDIAYTDAKNIRRRKDKVEVQLKNPNETWFPIKGNLVKLDVFEENVIITGEVITNYSSQVKEKQYTKNNIYANGDDSSVGCYIF